MALGRGSSVVGDRDVKGQGKVSGVSLNKLGAGDTLESRERLAKLRGETSGNVTLGTGISWQLD